MISQYPSTVKLRSKTKNPTKDSPGASFFKRITRFININKPIYQIENSKNDQLELGRLSITDPLKSKLIVNQVNEELSYTVQQVGFLSNLFPYSVELLSCSVIENKLFIGVENRTEIFILRYDEKCQELIMEKTWNPILKSFSLYPLQIKSDDVGNIYLSAYYFPKMNEDQKLYLLLKYDRDFNLIIKTKQYPFLRFSDFDFDSDDCLVIISSSKEDPSVYHVSKLTEDFNKFKYKFNFSSATSKYIPHKVLCLGLANKSWIIAYKDENNKKEPRLISFRSEAVRDKNESMQSFMTKINTSAWSSGNFQPIEICKLTSQYSLSIDEKTKALYCLSWDNKNDCPDVSQVSSYGEPYFKKICTNSNGTAYLFTHNSIYKFSTSLKNGKYEIK